MKIAFIHHSDIRVDNDAISNYIRGILRYNTEHEIDCYGISKCVSEKQGVANQENSNFHVIFKQRQKRFLPLTLKYIFLLWTKRSKLPLKGKLLSLHAVEWALPFLYPWKTGLTVVTIHGASKFSQIAWESKIRIWFYDLVEKLVLKKADKVILVSHEGCEYYASRYPNLKDKFIHIPTFVDENLFFPKEDKSDLRKKFGIQIKDVVLIYTGRLVKEKGIDILISAFKQVGDKFPFLRLIIVGKGPQEKYLKSMVENQGINNVVFLGIVNHQKIPEILNCADLFVLPSAFEGTPLAVLEALACGVPVISFDVGDISRIITDGLNGYLVKNRTSKALARAIISGIETRSKMQRNCRKTTKNYWASNVIPKILDIYNEVRFNAE